MWLGCAGNMRSCITAAHALRLQRPHVPRDLRSEEDLMKLWIIGAAALAAVGAASSVFAQTGGRPADGSFVVAQAQTDDAKPARCSRSKSATAKGEKKEPPSARWRRASASANAKTAK